MFYYGFVQSIINTQLVQKKQNKKNSYAGYYPTPYSTLNWV